MIAQERARHLNGTKRKPHSCNGKWNKPRVTLRSAIYRGRAPTVVSSFRHPVVNDHHCKAALNDLLAAQRESNDRFRCFSVTHEGGEEEFKSVDLDGDDDDFLSPSSDSQMHRPLLDPEER